MIDIILWLWQFPQNLVGFVLSRFRKGVVSYMVKGKAYNVYYTHCFGTGVCLGSYILLDIDNYWIDRHEDSVYMIVCHESGHAIQSKILGPLYLFFVGFISLFFNNLWDRLFHRKWDIKKRLKWYYKRYPEKWADQLGGVKRIN